MSQSDFQARLKRLQINSASPVSNHPPNRVAPPRRITRPSKLSWLIALALTFAGSQAAKFANTHYDEIKASYGIEGALLIGCAALALLLIGTLLFLRALWKQLKGAPLHHAQRDFQEPLNTRDTSADPNDLPSGRAPNPGRTRPTTLSWLIALAFTFAGSQAAKFANTHYDEIKASYGVEGALLVGCAALALLLFGSILFLRAVWRQFKPSPSEQMEQPRSKYVKAPHVSPQSSNMLDQPLEQPNPEAPKKPSTMAFLVPMAFIFMGSQLSEFTNEKRELLKADYGLQGAALAAGVAVTLMSLGGILLLWTLWRQFRANRWDRVHAPERLPNHFVSSRTKTLYSLIGLAIGVAAALAFVLADVGRRIETDHSMHIALFAILTCYVLVAVAWLVGMGGLLLFRGRGLARVPFYAMAGGGLTFLGLYLSPLEIAQWKFLINSLP